jgi:N-acetylmuramic acid 6-phosphate etherase
MADSPFPMPDARSDPQHSEGVDDAFARALIDSQKAAIAAVEAALPAIIAASMAMTQALRAGGRAVYVGAGSSGLIALQDGAELPGTFGLKQDSIAFVIAGGLADIANIDAAAEDDREAAARDMARVACAPHDIVIAVSASGSTPYTLACVDAAKGAGAKVIALANRPGAPLLQAADFPILLACGPEALHGSTRLGAGTAQKAALGLLSTLANAGLGHVWRGHMVNVRPDNDKLRARAAHIVASLAGVASEAASQCLSLADSDVKCAILLASGAASPQRARAFLDSAQGHVGVALAQMRRSREFA